MNSNSALHSHFLETHKNQGCESGLARPSRGRAGARQPKILGRSFGSLQLILVLSSKRRKRRLRQQTRGQNPLPGSESDVAGDVVQAGISNKQLQQQGEVSHHVPSIGACCKSPLSKWHRRVHLTRYKHTDPDQIFYFTSPAWKYAPTEVSDREETPLCLFLHREESIIQHFSPASVAGKSQTRFFYTQTLHASSHLPQWDK